MCSVDGGASVNCPSTSLIPHGNGTHTECVGHALPGVVALGRDVPLPPPLLPALLLSVSPGPLGESGDDYAPGAPSDAVVSRALVVAALARACPAARTALAACGLGAVILRTCPNPPDKAARDWSNAGAAYLTPAAMLELRAAGCAHLVLDLPSVDREDDGGQLLAHRAFWGLPRRGDDAPAAEAGPAQSALCPRTITELAYIPDAVPDGPYLLALHVAPIELDAAPSRPLVLPARVRAEEAL